MAVTEEDKREGAKDAKLREEINFIKRVIVCYSEGCLCVSSAAGGEPFF